MNDTHYFNLYTNGLGYLNRIREVTPKKGAFSTSLMGTSRSLTFILVMSQLPFVGNT
ncbi:DUF3577 domain-containing protein [Citrobacter werkmanii]|uniref:DUF3577 domain-containing protein n=1 Tax=Citrobacter werkmanii TaxID=67827 RepID=UPI00300DB971